MNKFFKYTDTFSPYKSAIFYVDYDKKIQITVADDFTKVRPYLLFNNINIAGCDALEDINNELSIKLQTLMDRIKEDIEVCNDFNSYISKKMEYLKQHHFTIYKNINERNCGTELSAYYIRRNTLDQGLDIPFIEDEIEFSLAKKYFNNFHANKDYNPSVGDFVNYCAIYSGKIIKIDNFVYLSNLNYDYFNRVLKILKGKFMENIQNGMIEKIDDIKFDFKYDNVLIIHQGGSENYYEVYENILTEDEIEWISNNPDCCDENTEKYMAKLIKPLFSSSLGEILTVCNSFGLNIVATLEHYIY
jgi:hypothetical protein